MVSTELRQHTRHAVQQNFPAVVSKQQHVDLTDSPNSKAASPLLWLCSFAGSAAVNRHESGCTLLSRVRYTQAELAAELLAKTGMCLLHAPCHFACAPELLPIWMSPLPVMLPKQPSTADTTDTRAQGCLPASQQLYHFFVSSCAGLQLTPALLMHTVNLRMDACVLALQMLSKEAAFDMPIAYLQAAALGYHLVGACRISKVASSVCHAHSKQPRPAHPCMCASRLGLPPIALVANLVRLLCWW